MAFRWRADDGPLLWYLDPLSPHQLKWHWIFFYVRVKTFWIRVCRERERERERERGREREREREQLINEITNERTYIGKDERTNGKTKTIHPRHKRRGYNECRS